MAGVVVRPRQLGDAEVEDLDPPVVRDEQVVGLHVAMDDALVVRGGEPLRSLARVVDGFARRQRASLQPAAERFALEQFGDDVGRAGVDADIVDGQDVRVIESARPRAPPARSAAPGSHPSRTSRGSA